MHSPSLLPLHTLAVSHYQDVLNYFPQNSAELKNYVEKAKRVAEETLDAIRQIPLKDRNFENTFYALDAAETLIYSRRRAIEAISKTHPEASMRREANEYKDQLVEFSMRLFGCPTVYVLFKEANQNIQKEKHTLSAQKAAHLQRKLHALETEGLHLEATQYQKIQQLNSECHTIESLFLKNIDEDISYILVKEEDLLGVPESLVPSFSIVKGLKKVSCQYPHYFPVMRYCKIEETRKALFRAFENRAADKNVPLLIELIQKRDLLAKALGFKSFAHLDVSDQLAKTPENVEKFILSLKAGIQEKYALEINKLIHSLPSEIHLDPAGKIKPWDLMYLQEAYKKEHHHVDELLLQQYFPFERTLKKMMLLFEELFSLNIELIDGKALWNTPGFVLAVKDKETQRLAGHIILDPFPREGKFPHGYCFDVLSPCGLPDGEVNPGIVLMMVNFTSPTSERESILRHDELVILFHEFGHAMHQLLGTAEMASRSGYHIERDALEWPSRLFEFFMWDPQILKRLGEHYKTGEALPDSLIQAKIASKNAASGLTYMRFFYLSLFSLKCFSSAIENPKLLREELEEDFLKGIAVDTESHKEASFLHLAEHFYRSKFYAYFWADVFAFDTFAHIESLSERGNKEGWLQFRRLLLDNGGGIDPNKLAEEFLGRVPNIEAYISKISS